MLCRRWLETRTLVDARARAEHSTGLSSFVLTCQTRSPPSRRAVCRSPLEQVPQDRIALGSMASARVADDAGLLLSGPSASGPAVGG